MALYITLFTALFAASEVMAASARAPSATMYPDLPRPTPIGVNPVNGSSIFATNHGYCANQGDCNSIRDCANFLRNKGTTSCAVPGSGFSAFCESGSIQIYGVSTTGRGESSYCRDVACAVDWVVNNCRSEDNKCGGMYIF
jgi:hypothetical protein